MFSIVTSSLTSVTTTSPPRTTEPPASQIPEASNDAYKVDGEGSNTTVVAAVDTTAAGRAAEANVAASEPTASSGTARAAEGTQGRDTAVSSSAESSVRASMSRLADDTDQARAAAEMARSITRTRLWMDALTVPPAEKAPDLVVVDTALADDPGAGANPLDRDDGAKTVPA